MRLKLVDSAPAPYEFLVFNRCDRLWVDAWLIKEATPRCQQMLILHKIAWHDTNGKLEQRQHVRYRWIRKKSQYYRLRKKVGTDDQQV